MLSSARPADIKPDLNGRGLARRDREDIWVMTVPQPLHRRGRHAPFSSLTLISASSCSENSKTKGNWIQLGLRDVYPLVVQRAYQRPPAQPRRGCLLWVSAKHLVGPVFDVVHLKTIFPLGAMNFPLWIRRQRWSSPALHNGVCTIAPEACRNMCQYAGAIRRPSSLSAKVRA